MSASAAAYSMANCFASSHRQVIPASQLQQEMSCSGSRKGISCTAASVWATAVQPKCVA